MDNLKPCPFCGNEVVRRIGLMGLNFFKCKSCGAVTSLIMIIITLTKMKQLKLGTGGRMMKRLILLFHEGQ